MDYRSAQSGRTKTVCGQAHTVLENLARTNTLPPTLSLSIEEILECAWEIAYRTQEAPKRGAIIPFFVVASAANVPVQHEETDDAPAQLRYSQQGSRCS